MRQKVAQGRGLNLPLGVARELVDEAVPLGDRPFGEEGEELLSQGEGTPSRNGCRARWIRLRPIFFISSATLSKGRRKDQLQTPILSAATHFRESHPDISCAPDAASAPSINVLRLMFMTFIIPQKPGARHNPFCWAMRVSAPYILRSLGFSILPVGLRGTDAKMILRGRL